MAKKLRASTAAAEIVEHAIEGTKGTGGLGVPMLHGPLRSAAGLGRRNPEAVEVLG